MPLIETNTYAELGLGAPEPVDICPHSRPAEDCRRCDDFGFDYGVDEALRAERYDE